MTTENTEIADPQTQIHEEGRMVKRIAQIVLQHHRENGDETPITPEAITKAYKENFPRDSRAAVNLGVREIAQVCLFMVSKDYLVQEDNALLLTDAGRGLVS